MNHREDVASNSNPQRKNPRQLSRLNLFLLVRILFHYLEKIDRTLLVQAKEVLKDCEKRQKDDNPEFPTLAVAIQTRVREAVGETHWSKALVIQRQYLINQQKSKKLAVVRQIAKRGQTGPSAATKPNDESATARRSMPSVTFASASTAGDGRTPSPGGVTSPKQEEKPETGH